jgi:hypothetical protein
MDDSLLDELINLFVDIGQIDDRFRILVHCYPL